MGEGPWADEPCAIGGWGQGPFRFWRAGCRHSQAESLCTPLNLNAAECLASLSVLALVVLCACVRAGVLVCVCVLVTDGQSRFRAWTLDSKPASSTYKRFN